MPRSSEKIKMILCPANSGPHLELLRAYLEKEGVEVRFLSWFGKDIAWNMFQLTKARAAGYRSLGLNWLPFNDMLRMRMARWACRFLGIHMIWTIHNLSPHIIQFGSREADEKAMKYMVAWAEAGVMHSDRSRALFQSKYGTSLDIAVVPLANYIDLVQRADAVTSRKRLGIPEGKTVVLMLGPDRWTKGIRAYLEVVASLPDDYLGVLSGRCGNLEIEELIGRYKEDYPDRFSVRLGYLDNEEMGGYYAASDIIFMPYEDITTSGSIMEAISHGKAVVSTDRGHLYMIVRNGENGYLAEDREEMALYLRSIDRGKAREMGKKSLEIAKLFTWEDTARSYIHIIEEVKNKKHRRGTSSTDGQIERGEVRE